MTGVQTGADEKSKQGPQLMQVMQSFKSLPEFILGQEGPTLTIHRKMTSMRLSVGDNLRNLAALRSKDGVCG